MTRRVCKTGISLPKNTDAMDEIASGSPQPWIWIPRSISAGLLAALVFAWCAAFSAAHAIDLTGAWATDAGVCDKVFVKKGNTVSFHPKSGLSGGGFIMEGRRIRGRAATCTITRTKEEKDVIHLIAACATDIMLSNVQFSLKTVDDNKVSRIFPGMEGMELPYYRCPR
jgi:hypothetical protein